MRFFIICFLFSLALSGQAEQKFPSKYVWAESGLTLRKEGKKGAEKISVIPFGAEVFLTGRSGKRLDLEALPSINYSWNGKEKISESYIMNGYYLEVEYDGQSGFVYSGFLSYYPTDLPMKSNTYWESWITDIGGSIDTLLFNCTLPECGRSESRFLYANGITRTDRILEGGVTSVFTFPLGDINDGFLLGCRFFGFSYSVEHYEEILHEGQYEPTFLNVQEDGALFMDDDMCSTSIQYISGMLVITTSCSC